MSELKHGPVKHDHAAFLAKAATCKGFFEAYASLELEYQVVSQLLKARTKAGLTREAVAQRLGTSKSPVSRRSLRDCTAPRSAP